MRHTSFPTVLLLVAGLLLCRPLAAQTSPYLCSGGPRDGRACGSDDDCFVSCPSSFGACVVVQGVCDGGDYDGFPCDCPEGFCDASGGKNVCVGGAFDGYECRPGDGEGACGPSACVGTSKVCQSGTYRAFGCLRDEQCYDPANGDVWVSCVSTGLFCDGGDYADYSCVDSSDCGTEQTGMCRAPETDCPSAGCIGDCSNDNTVTIDELVTMVNIALTGSPAAPVCIAGDQDGDGTITINEIIAAVNNALLGCG